jgi:magnesium-transporting ATPase (P-type)
LVWAATFYFLLTFFGKDTHAYVEALTIYSGLLFSAGISALCDWVKELEYLSLKDEINNQQVVVYRGYYGTCLSIPIRELVVGDIIDL